MRTTIQIQHILTSLEVALNAISFGYLKWLSNGSFLPINLSGIWGPTYLNIIRSGFECNFVRILERIIKWVFGQGLINHRVGGLSAFMHGDCGVPVGWWPLSKIANQSAASSTDFFCALNPSPLVVTCPKKRQSKVGGIFINKRSQAGRPDLNSQAKIFY